jgi:hypothetical protein
MRQKLLALTFLSLSLAIAMVSKQPKNGTIYGSVSIDSMPPLTRVFLTLTNMESNVRFRTETNDSGEYKLAVPPGKYELTSWVRGDVTWIRLRLNEGESLKKDLRLAVSPSILDRIRSEQ